MSQNVGPQTAQRRKAYAQSDGLGLTREERMELAEYLLRRDVTTWKTLDDEQICRLLDAMDGFEFICHLLGARP